MLVTVRTRRICRLSFASFILRGQVQVDFYRNIHKSIRTQLLFEYAMHVLNQRFELDESWESPELLKAR